MVLKNVFVVDRLPDPNGRAYAGWDRKGNGMARGNPPVHIASPSGRRLPVPPHPGGSRLIPGPRLGFSIAVAKETAGRKSLVQPSCAV